MDVNKSSKLPVGKKSSRWIWASVLALFVLVLNPALGPAAGRSASAQSVPAATHVPGDDAQLSGVSSDATLPQHLSGTVNLMLQMSGEPAVATYNKNKVNGEAAAIQAGKAQKDSNDREQKNVLPDLNAKVPNAKVLYRVQNAYNGIAVVADASDIPALRALPDVASVQVIPLATISNFNSVPFIGAPSSWTAAPGGRTGTGIKIGIIDTGIDYLHANFAGPGTSAAYAANNTTTIGDTPGYFPNGPKVIGGTDLAGNGYDASAAPNSPALIPHPDPDPMDCNGHGSHVAGTVAGYGVNADGTTYTGAYDNSTPFTAMRIGPGVAPGAQLYAIRVFGCTGSTSLVTEAIDWAMDPNGDGNFSDHLDVINMSLGSSFGTAESPDSVAADNAAQTGVIVVASAGNSGDNTYVHGSPASDPRTIAVAASVDGGNIVSGFDVTAPTAIAGTYPSTWSVNYKPSAAGARPLPVNVNAVYLPTNATACSPLSPTDAAAAAGNVLVVDWVPSGASTFPCGSAARANNAYNAGAAGVVVVDNTNFFSTSLAGNATEPMIFTTADTGAAIKGQLAASTPVLVTFTHAHDNAIQIVNNALADTLASFSSRGPAGHSNLLKPDISAPGVNVFSTASGTGTQGITESGTSMAAPHITGVMALLRQEHPTWSVEELKALAMNTAGHDLWTGNNRTGVRYSPQRVGAGRVDVTKAISSDVVAFSADNPGAVSVSFGAVEVAHSTVLTRTVDVVNHGSTAMTYTPSYDAYSSIPGVSYRFPDGSTVSVPAGGSTTFHVQLLADPSLMKNTRDATLAGAQDGIPRQWLSEASGIITLTPTSGTPLRVPVYASARPVSNMSTLKKKFSVGDSSVTLTGSGISTGTTPGTDINSLVSAFELQDTSPKLTLPAGAPASTAAADLQYVGVTTDARAQIAHSQPLSNSKIYFGLSTYGNWSLPQAYDTEFDIVIDTNNDGTPDFILFNWRVADASNSAGTDVFVSSLLNLATGVLTNQGFTNAVTSNVPSAIYNTNVLLMPVSAGALGLSSTASTFHYFVQTFANAAYPQGGAIDSTPNLVYDIANQGFDFNGGSVGAPLYFDLPNTVLPAVFNQAGYDANHDQGILLLHHYNADGSRAQVLGVSKP